MNQPSGSRVSFFDEELKAFSSVPVIPLGSIGDFFNSVHPQLLARSVELNGRVFSTIAGSAFQNHLEVAIAYGFGSMYANLGIHEQGVGIPLTEWLETLQVVHQFRRDIVQRNMGIDGQSRLNITICRHLTHYRFQAALECGDIGCVERESRRQGMPAETIQKIRTLFQGGRQVDAVDAARRTFAPAVSGTDHDCRPIELPGETRGDNAQDTLVPVVAIYYQNRTVNLTR
jgi:hypothetical protein